MTRPHIGLLLMISGLGIATAAALYKTRTEMLSTQADVARIQDDARSLSASVVRADWPVGLMDISVQDLSARPESPEEFRERVKADFAFYLDNFPPEKRP